MLQETGPSSQDRTSYQYNSLNQLTAKEVCSYVSKITMIHDYGYTYDNRGNLVKEEEICSPTTQGPRNITIGTYLYDETDRMVQGTNKDGEASLYTFNGLGVRVGSELILEDNTHGYTDFHCLTPSIETTVGGPQGPEVVKADYVIDYTRLNIDQRVLMKLEEGGYDFRYVYGLDKIQVTVNSEGSNWWGQNIKPCVMMNYVHTDRLGSVVGLSDQYGRVTARADYDDWGKIIKYTDITVDGGFRRLLPEITYATHEYDDVLGQFYAKARMYDADNRRFAAVDPILDPDQYDLREYVQNPVQFVQYLYVENSPLIYVDYLGMFLPGTMLTEGASGTDIRMLNNYLINHDYRRALSGSEKRRDLDMLQYSKATTSAVKRFQENNDLNPTGTVDKETWEKMGFSVNSTIAEEFFLGKRGNDVISMEIKDNKITINYFPTLYACTTSYLKIRHHKEGLDNYHTLYDGKVSDEIYEEYENRIIEGILQWAQAPGKISIQGVDVEVVVNVQVTRTKDKDKANFIVKTGDSRGFSITKSAINWNYHETPHISLHDGGFKDGQDMVANLAAHEFGHVLGVFDAYGYGSHCAPLEIILPTAPSDRAKDTDVMRSAWGIEYSYLDVYELVLYAWTRNRLQLYTESGIESLGGEVSQAFYR